MGDRAEVLTTISRRWPRPIRRVRLMKRALSILAFGGCERTTKRGTYCWTREDWSPECHYTADKWCDACIAAAGLRGAL